MDLGDLVVKVKGDVSDALAKLGVLKGAVKDVGDQSSKSSKGMQDDFKKTGSVLDQFGSDTTFQLKKSGTAFDQLKQKSKDLNTEIANLTKELKKTGSTNILGDLSKTQADLTKVNNLLKTMGASKQVLKDLAADGQKAANSWTQNFGQSASQWMSTAFSPGGVIGAAVIGAAAVLLVPAVGALLSAGIASAVGVGLIGAAAYIQKDTPVVASAFTQLKDTAVAIFKTATEPLAGTFAIALNNIDQLLENERPQIDALFSTLGPSIKMISADFGSFLQEILPGLDKVAQAFNTAFTDPTVQRSIQNAQVAFEALLNTIGNHPELIAEGMRLFAGAVQFVTVMLNDLVGTASRLLGIWQGFTSGVNSVLKFFGTLGGTINNTKQAWQGAVLVGAQWHDGLTAQTQAIYENYDAVGQMNDAYGILHDSLVAASDATLGLLGNEKDLQFQMAQFSKEIKKNGDNWNDNTKAGHANWTQLLSNLGLAKQTYDAQIKAGAGADVATKAYDANVNKLITMAQNLGLSKKDADALRTSLLKIPGGKTISFTVDVKYKNLAELNKLEAAAGTRKASAQSGMWPGNMLAYANSGVNIPHYDASGVYQGTPGGIYRFAESSTGSEALIARNGDKGRALSSLATAANWFGGTVVINRAMASGMNYATATGGGGGGPYLVHTTLVVDGKAIVTAITPAAQRRKIRSGVTGLA